MKNAGVNYIVIPLDACTPELFDKIKGKKTNGPYSWENHIEGIELATKVFEKVGTHLMIGLGESDEDAIKVISEFDKQNVTVALFSYTYIPGTQLLPPDGAESEKVRHYRTVQLARHLIAEKISSFGNMKFRNGRLVDFGAGSETILDLINDGKAFQTSGCPDCNRPMANETFSKIYNFPGSLTLIDKEKIKRELGLLEILSPKS